MVPRRFDIGMMFINNSRYSWRCVPVENCTGGIFQTYNLRRNILYIVEHEAGPSQAAASVKDCKYYFFLID